MNYSIAHEAKPIAKELIEEHHGHLVGVTVYYVFMDEIPVSKGREIWGRAKKKTGLDAFLAQGLEADGDPIDESFFVIELAKPVWDRLTESEKRALVDHGLCYCKVGYDKDGETVLRLADHDIEEFNEVIERHGLWRVEIENFAVAVKKAGKLPLFDREEKDETMITISGGGKSVTMTDSQFSKAVRGKLRPETIRQGRRAKEITN